MNVQNDSKNGLDEGELSGVGEEEDWQEQRRGAVEKGWERWVRARDICTYKNLKMKFIIL